MASWVFVCCLGFASAADFTGYVVTAQWDGRTVPTVQWALDVTRQDTLFRPKQELKLQLLLPTTPGPALSPTFTAYDATSRDYFTAVRQNASAGRLWHMTINNAVDNSTVDPDVRFAFSQMDATFVGLEAWNNNGVSTPLALFADCTVLVVDWKTGATKKLLQMCDPLQQMLTTATELVGNVLYVVAQNTQGLVNRQIVQVDLTTLKLSSAPLQSIKNHDPMLELPFEMVWLPSLKTMMLFFSGNFDQIVYLEPNSGAMSFAFHSISDYGGSTGGKFEFTKNDRLEDDDLWTDVAVDTVQNKIYFQCSDVDPDSGLVTTALCEIPIPAKIKELDFINVAIEPMTYGYAGMEFVQVAA